MTATRIFTASATQHVGETVEVRGWVFRLRTLASTTFVVVRDCTGTVQCVYPTASFNRPHVKLDDVVAIVGCVRAEPRAKSGCEIDVTELRLLNAASHALPFNSSGKLSAVGTLLVGAHPDHFAAVRPILAAFSRRIMHFGAPGAGTAYKLLVNMLGAVQIAAVAEAMALGERAGLDPKLLAEAIGTGQAGSPQVIQSPSSIRSCSTFRCSCSRTAWPSRAARRSTSRETWPSPSRSSEETPETSRSKGPGRTWITC